MSGITFKNVTVTYNGTEHKVEIEGTLPEGVLVSYENNVGTNAGVYNAIAKFSYDTANYNFIEDLEAVLIINKDSLSFNTNTENEIHDIIISSDGGIDPTKELVVELIEIEESVKDFTEFLGKKEKVAVAYDVKLFKDGMSVQPDNTLKFRVLIPEDLKGKDFSIMHIHNGNEKDILEYEIDGEYIIFETDKLSEFVFVYEMGSLLWVVILLAVVALLETVFLLYLINKNKKLKSTKLTAAYPPFIFGMFIPEWHLALIIIFVIIVVALAVVDTIYALKVIGYQGKMLALDKTETSNINIEKNE